MRKTFIAGNWKMHGSRGFVAQILSDLKSKVKENIDLAVFPPFVYLAQASALLMDSNIQLGAQNMHAGNEGAYTGEVSAKMLKDVGCHYVLIGHSERRQLYHETDLSCLEKLLSAQANGLIPILCLGESLIEREQNQTFSVIEAQLMAIFNEKTLNSNKIVLAYEPLWAIGTGQTATPEIAQMVHAFIRQKITFFCGQDIATTMRILYGGSVKADNAAKLLSQPDIDGALVGGASLLAESFIEIISAATNGMLE